MLRFFYWVVSAIKEGNATDFKAKKYVLFILGLAVLIIAIIIGVLLLNENNGNNTNNINTTIIYKPGLTFAPTEKEEPSKEFEDANSQVSEKITNNIGAVQNNNQNNTVLPDPSGWSRAQIISKAKDAVNKTKAHQGNLTVNHTEGFTANVTECSAGGIIRSVVDLMIGWVVKPVDETLVYQNGRAVNSEGETVPIILPKRNVFSLDGSGVKSATIQQSGNEYIIKITLVEESVGMYDIPKHNASAVGYLDVSNFDISFMEVDSADIVYKGSSIELRINAEGLVTYANYKIPLHIEGSAHKGSISGSATFEGEQTEEWRLNW